MKTVVFSIACLLAVSPLFAQPPGSSGKNEGPLSEKVEALRIGYMTEKLDMSPLDAQKFWPVFGEYQKRVKSLDLTGRVELESLSDGDVEAQVKAHFTQMEEMLKINREYLVKFQEVLGQRKGAMVFVLQEDFKRFILERSRDRIREGRPGPDGSRSGERR